MATEVQRGLTKVEPDNVEYKWVIENFRLLEEWDGAVESSTFGTKDKQQEWILRFYPKGNTPDTDAVSLLLVSNCYRNTKVRCDISILRSDTVFKSRTFTHTYQRYGEAYGFNLFMKRSTLLSSRDTDNTITIYCKIHIPAKLCLQRLQPSDQLTSFNTGENQVTENFGAFFNETLYSDVTIIVENAKFAAHKIILASRSSVFAAMFEQNKMAENLTNEVKIDDLSPSVVKAMLEFIYTNKVTDLDLLGKELLKAADKYDLERLKVLCSKTIYDTVNEENAAEILIFADCMNAKRLKAAVMQYIVNYSDNVMQSDGFKKMEETLQSCPALLMELVHALGSNLRD